MPRGSIVTYQGDEQDGYLSVHVELTNGEAEGWIEETSIRRSKSKGGEDSAASEEEHKKTLRTKRPVLPKDEALLLKREPSFIYGVFLGPNYNVIMTQFSEAIYTGLGFTAGGHLGYFVTKSFVLKGHLGYSYATGAAEDGAVTFGLFDIGGSAEYYIDRFVLFAGVQYSIGMSVGNIPTTIQIAGAGDATSLWGFGGGGYRIRANELIDFVLRASYGASFARTPIGFQSFSFVGYLEIRG